MSKAVCSECQFIYDSRSGIPEAGIEPGTPFGSADDSIFFCPQCGSSKDLFVEAVEPPIEIDDPTDLVEIEAEHVPVYRVEDEDLVVEVGGLGVEHPQEIGHMIEWIEVRDETGEILDRAYFNQNEKPIARFSVDLDDPFEVYALCSEHGIWKWISHESTNL